MNCTIEEGGLTQFFYPVSDELEKVENELNQLIRTLGIYQVQDIIDEIGDMSDRYLRAGIVLLAAKSSMQDQTKPVDKQIIRLAAIMELVHFAIDVHNRIDEGPSDLNDILSSMNKIAVLVGDSLYTRAFFEATRTLPIDIFQIISELTLKMSLAEIKEELLNQFSMSVEKYFEIIEGKTALFFSKCTGLGASLALAGNSEVMHLEEIGRNLGMLYQISVDTTNENQCIPISLDLQEINRFIVKANKSLSILKDSIYKDNLIKLVTYFSAPINSLIYK